MRRKAEKRREKGRGGSEGVEEHDPVLHRSGKSTVDAETFQYFMEVSTLLGEGGGSITDPEELSTLCANALEETQGKELQLSCDRSCSRVLEALFPYCDMGHLMSFLHRSSPVFASIAMDASGSHVAEAALKSIAIVIHSSGTEQPWYEALNKVLLTICENIAKRAVDVMCSCYGSHVLRSILHLSSGTLLDTKNSRNSGGLACRLYRSSSNAYISAGKSIRSAFPDVLKFLVSMSLEGVRKSSFQLQMDPFAGPVLQTVLKALEGDSEAITKAITLVLGCAYDGIGNDGNVFQSVSKDRVMELVHDSKSSHLMEVILEVAPNTLYKDLLECFFRHSLLELSLHRYANFVVQALITSANHQDQVVMIFEELEKDFIRLIKEGRAGVMASLLAACGRFGVHQQQACRLIARAIIPASQSLNCLIPRMLFLEIDAKREDLENWIPRSQGKVSILGCAMLETIFSYPKECNQQFFSSLTALDTSYILEMTKDATASHVIESFLTSSAPHKQKQRIVSRLKGNFGQLAVDSKCSFILEKCFSVANITLKEEITSELALIEDELLKTKHGPYLLKKCDIAGFLKSPERWRIRIKSKQDILKGFSEIIHSGVENSYDPDQLNRLTTSVNEATTVIETQNTGAYIGHLDNVKPVTKDYAMKNLLVDNSCFNSLMEQLESHVSISNQRPIKRKRGFTSMWHFLAQKKKLIPRKNNQLEKGGTYPEDEINVPLKRRIQQSSISKKVKRKRHSIDGKTDMKMCDLAVEVF